MATINASIIGGSGYTGGELIRLLWSHENVNLIQITSRSFAGRSVSKIHPHLRHVDIKFSSPDDLVDVDVMFLAVPHGISQKNIDEFRRYTKVIIDLSSDFRLHTSELYTEWYGKEHLNPELLQEFVYGIVELNREKIKNSNLISSAGCNATASILALYPLFKQNLINNETRVLIDVKVGSSEGGKSHSISSHHPERSGVLRVYQPSNHRHTAEIISQLRLKNVHFTATAVDMVRGVSANIQVLENIKTKELWQSYTKTYQNEPFVRLINERSGNFRLPEPKILTGTNYCDIGFARDEINNSVVLVSALDNLMKGASGQAVQAMNVRFGFPETTSIDFTGVFPI